MRLGRIAIVLFLAALSGCSTIGDAVDKLNPFARASAKTKPAELPSFTPSAEMAVRWRAEIGAAGEFVFAPAVVGKSVFAAAKEGILARFDEGREIWRIRTERILSGGVGADERVVVVGTPKGEVLAYSPQDGRLLWSARVSSEVLAPPVVSGDLVIVRSLDHRLFALDVQDGKRRWLYQRSTPPLALRAATGVVATSKAVLAGFPGGKLVAIAPHNGAPLWEATVAIPRGATELERIADVVGEPLVIGAEVCAVAYQGRLACFDLDSGRALWAREVSSLTGLAATERMLIISDEKDHLLAFERSSGASLWKQDKLTGRGLTRPLALGRRVAVADALGHLHLVDGFDGGFVARLSLDGAPVKAPPLRYGDGLLVQTQNGALFAVTIR